MERSDDLDDMADPDEHGDVGRIASWFKATPAELVGLTILVLGAIAVTVTLWLQAVQRPNDLPNDAVAAGVDADSGQADGAAPGGDSTEVAGDEVGTADEAPAGSDAGADTPTETGHAHHGGPGEGDGADGGGAGDPGSAGENGGGSAAGDTADEVAEPEEIAVHVTGAVGEPGLVTIMSDSRVADAVTAAGGMTDEAEPELLNLARSVTDGEHVHVPVEGEDPLPATEPPAPTEPAVDTGATPDADADGAGSGNEPVIDINQASADELETLPGVGPSRAEAIVAYREENGPFATPGDLRGVTGIGEAIFQNLADRVTVG